jgi:D-aminoacyl-tRNA deacylase
MRAVVQRVKQSNVTIDGKCISVIKSGLLVLLGISKTDNQKDIDYISDKILNLRIFKDHEDKMNESIIDISGELIIVSQFTLYGDARKGRRPSFDNAADGKTALIIYEKFIDFIKSKYDRNRIFTGVFGSMMEVGLINDGPVTILLDSERRF